MVKHPTFLCAGLAGLVLAAVPVAPSLHAPYGLEASHADAVTYRRARVAHRRAYRRGYYGGGYYGGTGYPSRYGYGAPYGYPYYPYRY